MCPDGGGVFCLATVQRSIDAPRAACTIYPHWLRRKAQHKILLIAIAGLKFVLLLHYIPLAEKYLMREVV